MNPPFTSRRTACVIGSGPNGLSAAIVLAQAGLQVDVFEAESTIGGACRTLDLTLPGFHHDFGSAVHPLGAGSPFFATLPLADYGLEWIHSPAPLAHPLGDGACVTLERGLAAAEAALGSDGPAWRSLVHPFVTRWDEFALEVLSPILHIPRSPMLLARFGVRAMQPAAALARSRFRTREARALFGGIAAHSSVSLDASPSAAFGMVLSIAAHAVGWPIPRGGAQSLTDALAAHLAHLGGRIHAEQRIRSFADLPASGLILCDTNPQQILTLAPPGAFNPAYRRNIGRSPPREGVFKVDYALASPIPWNSPACLRAATLHLGGTLEEIAASESAVARGQHAERPFVLLAQPTLFDPTRAPEGKHIAWAYCHVPNGSTETEGNLDRLEAQIDRFAPGFQSTIMARHISTPATLESMDANLLGGDISGGGNSLARLLLRPTHRQYSTPAPNIYLCSSSTPPGGGVHGMCGYHAARRALRELDR